MRFSTQCARCGRALHMGDRALKQYGHYWHNSCVIEYRKHREALRARSNG